MSRQPSPHPLSQQMYHQIPLAPSGSSKPKPKPHVAGITAGAEDVKYQGKYKELKKKVKEIELDNDRLYLKLLLAKKNIRRMNLERAILYERLAAVPPTPGRQTQELPAEHDPVFAQPPPQAPQEPPRPVAQDRHALEEYLQHNPNARLIEDQEGRVIAIEEPLAGRGGALGISGPPPPPGIPIIPSYRQEPAPDYPPERRLVALIGGPQDGLNNEVTVRHSRSVSSHIAGTRSHHRSRSSSSRNEVDQYPIEPSRLDTLPPSHPVHSRSSSLSGDGQVDSRTRRMDVHESSHPHQHSQIPAPNLPPSPQQVHSPTHGRLHNHQRVGPGVHLHRQTERDPEETRQLMHERELEREREREREQEMRLRDQRAREEEEELRRSMWAPQGQAYAGPGTSGELSRADSPHSDSSEDMTVWPPGYTLRRAPSGPTGASEPSRPASGQSREREGHRGQPGARAGEPYEPYGYYAPGYEPEDRMPVSSTRVYPADYRTAEPSSRKRSRHDMEIDNNERAGEHEPARTGGAAADAYPISQELRGPRRAHEDEGDVTRLHTSSIRDEKPMDQDD